MKANKWSFAEIKQLELIGDQYPLKITIQKYQTWARLRRQPPRTARSIHGKLSKLGICYSKRIASGELLSTRDVADILGFSTDRMVYVVDKNTDILCPVWAGRRRYANRANWRQLAMERPRIFGGCTANKLFVLLEDRDLAEHISKNYRFRLGDYRIQCLETKQIWANACAAARDLFISPSALTLAIRQNKPVPTLGLTFERLADAVSSKR